MCTAVPALSIQVTVSQPLAISIKVNAAIFDHLDLKSAEIYIETIKGVISINNDLWLK